MTIKRRINQLIPPKQRGKKRLAPVSSTRRIAAGRGVGKPAAASDSLKGPFVEIAGQRSYHDGTHEIASSDGLLVYVYRNLAGMAFRDGGNKSVTFTFDDAPQPA